MSERTGFAAGIPEAELQAVLAERAAEATLPARFRRPSALVRAAGGKRGRLGRRLMGAVAALFLMVAVAGVTAAAQPGVLDNLLQRLRAVEQEQASMEHKVKELRQRLAAARTDSGALGAQGDEGAPDVRLSYPVSPVQVLDRYGRRHSPDLREWRLHTGMDFATRAGQPVHAAAGGTVLVAEQKEQLGGVVVIDHGQVGGHTLTTWYKQNAEVKVRPGQVVKRGEVIALSGTAGLSTGPHLHFEVWVDGDPVDPTQWLEEAPQ